MAPEHPKESHEMDHDAQPPPPSSKSVVKDAKKKKDEKKDEDLVRCVPLLGLLDCYATLLALLCSTKTAAFFFSSGFSYTRSFFCSC
jgi:hypothetical protein